MRLFWNMRRGLVAFVAAATFYTGGLLPAKAAGSEYDLPWGLIAIVDLALFVLLASSGWALAKCGPRQFTLLVLAGWLIAWFCLSYARGLSGAIERAGIFSGLMAAVSVVVLLGWVLGRILRVPDEPAASVSNGHS